MDVLFYVLGGICLVVGFVGCILPVIPGPPIAWLAILFVELGRAGPTFPIGLHIALLVMVVIVTVLDLVVPAWGAKRYGATRTGVVLSIVGMVIGMIVFAPLGFLLGAFVGALAGELLEGKSMGPALRASWGVFVGTLAGIFLKLASCVAITYFYVVALL